MYVLNCRRLHTAMSDLTAFVFDSGVVALVEDERVAVKVCRHRPYLLPIVIMALTIAISIGYFLCVVLLTLPSCLLSANWSDDVDDDEIN